MFLIGFGPFKSFQILLRSVLEVLQEAMTQLISLRVQTQDLLGMPVDLMRQHVSLLLVGHLQQRATADPGSVFRDKHSEEVI